VDLSGEWAYQALNAGDTSFQVEHKGDSLKLYRVLHPEYQGERYKLEHLFRATLRGDEIRGELHVREEGMPEFEKLRVFSGRVQSADRMLVDELPLRRTGPGPDSARPPETAETAAGPAEPPITKVIIQPRAEAGAQVAEAASPPAGDPGLAAAAPTAIPELVPVSGRLDSQARREAAALLGEGDQAYDAQRFEEAVRKYLQAFKLDPQRVEVLYKLGLGHAWLADRAARGNQPEAARILYQQALEAWERAYRLDPYNWGTKENLRRARLKLGALK
jgi:tetratricopeptide (TPR) repeat protein